MATPTFFSHEEIVAVISDVNPFQSFLLNFFGSEHLSNDEKINFDRLSKDERIAVFVNPRRPGEVNKQRGFSVDSYKPGYIKDKDTIDFKHVIRRRAGQPFNAAVSPEQNYAAIVADLAANQVTKIYRRLELMAAQLLLNGTYDMVGKDLNVNVDFARDAALTETLLTTNRWLDANTSVSPIEDIEKKLLAVSYPVKTLIVGAAAWRAIKRDPLFDKNVYVDLLTRGQSPLVVGPQGMSPDGLIYRGNLLSSGVDIYTYTNTYQDPDSGNETLYIPTDAVIGVSDPSFGFQCFAPIQDAAANFMPMPYFTKNWMEEDPGIPYIMTQSAPLLAHTKINSTFALRTGATITGA
jgi:hypothetical protein